MYPSNLRPINVFVLKMTSRARAPYHTIIFFFYSSDRNIQNHICFLLLLFFWHRDVPDFFYENRVRSADIRILPEIVLSHPIYGCDSNSLSKFRLSENMKAKLVKYQSHCTFWPSFVFDIYDVDRVIRKIKTFLATLKIGEHALYAYFAFPLPLLANIFSFFFSQKQYRWTWFRCPSGSVRIPFSVQPIDEMHF